MERREVDLRREGGIRDDSQPCRGTLDEVVKVTKNCRAATAEVRHIKHSGSNCSEA